MDKRGPKSKNPEPRNQGNDEKKSKKGLRLLARVKPSEIFLKSITKDVTNVQITYPCRFQGMAEKSCVKRLQKEYRALCKEPVSHVVARPSPSDILEWHYVLEGSEGTPFAGGYYYGKIKFPPEYPYKPPGITMITPNGRFMTQKKICLSMSDFHPESWNSMWSVSSYRISVYLHFFPAPYFQALILVTEYFDM
ncbi:hypothetical protein ES332_D07G057600v1 [Gossypium tomentosum]|uniref:UBC core domain-containing protein n=1 Tax=Gossypium tomentosum TaxID=34277 RepID=A0A5D2K414_GOSTO|nr:hypothetical protein ES332_D07G057600v1 [Gossypium tomentosum]